MIDDFQVRIQCSIRIYISLITSAASVGCGRFFYNP